MIIPFLKIFGLGLFLMGFLLILRPIAEKMNWNMELQRKTVHVVFGLTAISFPWIFDELWEVLTICSLAVIVLLCIRTIPKLKTTLGKAIFDVNRFSYGDLIFGVSVILLFWLHDNNYALYVIPLAILTISDTAAALVGKRYGKKTYSVIGGTKSWIGTFTFAGVTFLILLTCLYFLTPLPWINLLLIAMTFAVLGSLIEAVSWHGFDNLFIPLAAYFFLSTFLNQELVELFYQICLLTGAILLGIIAGPKSRLDTHALMIAIIALYYFWVVGNLNWLIAPVLFFLFHIAFVKLQRDEVNYNVDAVISVASGGFFWLFMHKVFSVPYSLFFFTLAFAIHLEALLLIRLKAFGQKSAEPVAALIISFLSGGFLLSTTFFYYSLNSEMIILYIYALLVMFLSGILIRSSVGRFNRKRWTIQAALAILCSASALILILLMRTTV